MSTTTVCVESGWKERTERAIRDGQHTLNNCQAELERINRLTEQTLEAHRNNMRELSRVGEQAVDALTDSYNSIAGRFVNETNSQIAQLSGDFEGNIQSARSAVTELNSGVAVLDNSVTQLSNTFTNAFNRLIAQEQNQRERARITMEEFNRLMDSISSLSPDRFVPSEYASLRSTSQFINSSFDSGDYEAVVARSQASILAASATLARLTLMNERYVNAFGDAKDRVVALRRNAELAGARENQLQIPVGDTTETLDYDIRTWAAEDYNAILDAISGLEGRLNSDNVTIEELERIPDVTEILGRRLDECNRTAQEALVDSEAIRRLAVSAVESLSADGWDVDSAVFADNDEKKPVNIRATLNGNEVAIVVSNGAEIGEALFDIEAFADDDAAEREIKDGVRASILGDGSLTEEETQTQSDCHLNTSPEAFFDNINTAACGE